MHIRTPEEYRAVSEEARQLEEAREGTSVFKTRQELVTAMHEYELQHLADPNCRSGHPGVRSEMVSERAEAYNLPVGSCKTPVFCDAAQSQALDRRPGRCL